MVLSSSGWDRTCKLADTDEDGKVAEPDEDEAIDETRWSTTIKIKSIQALELGF